MFVSFVSCSCHGFVAASALLLLLPLSLSLFLSALVDGLHLCVIVVAAVVAAAVLPLRRFLYG